MITTEEYGYFVGRALDGMSRIVEALGDDLANRRPDLPGANTPYGLLTHCLGVVEYWAGALVAGRPVARDRDAEFEATGPVADIVARVAAARGQLAADVAVADLAAPLRGEPPAGFLGPDRPLTQGGALLHVYEELAQHHGQMEVLRDALVAGGADASRNRPPAQTTAQDARRPGDEDGAGPFGPLDLTWLEAKPGVKWHRHGSGVLAAWVADMDFPIPPPVRRALQRQLDGGDLGYPDFRDGTPLRTAFSERMAARYGWRPDPAGVRELTDLLQGVQLVLHLATAPGDAVALATPAYPPFLATIERMERRLVPIPMESRPCGWRFDADRAAADLAAAGCRVLLLVNPHNPTGRVLTREELCALGVIAEQQDLVVLADEIWAELTYPGHEHVPFASLSPELADRTVTLTSATKAFNLAGIRCAVAHMGPRWLREARDAAPPDLHGQPSVPSIVATLAAWRDGDAWLRGVVEHLDGNRQLLAAALAERLPEVRHHPPEATYLSWLDLRPLAAGVDPAAAVLARGRLALSPGPEFGPGGGGFARLNFATSREVLEDALDRLVSTLAPGR